MYVAIQLAAVISSSLMGRTCIRTYYIQLHIQDVDYAKNINEAVDKSKLLHTYIAIQQLASYIARYLTNAYVYTYIATRANQCSFIRSIASIMKTIDQNISYLASGRMQLNGLLKIMANTFLPALCLGISIPKTPIKGLVLLMVILKNAYRMKLKQTSKDDVYCNSIVMSIFVWFLKCIHNRPIALR